MTLHNSLAMTCRTALILAGHCCLLAALATPACVQAGANHDDGTGGASSGGTGGGAGSPAGSGGSGAGGSGSGVGGSGLGGATGSGGATGEPDTIIVP